MGTQTYTYALILYFVGITVVWTLMAPELSGEFSLDTKGYTLSDKVGNFSEEDVADTSVWSVGKMFTHIFSLYGWNLTVSSDSQLYPYLMYVKLVFVWLPGIFLLLTILYSLPTVSG